MARDSISAVVLGSATVEWAVVRPGERVPEKAGVEPLPRIVPVEAAVPRGPDESGGVGEAEASAGPSRHEVVSRVCGEFRGVVSVGLPSDQLILRVALLPADTVDELAGMVQLQIDKWSPFPVDQMAVSHDVLEKRENGFLVLMAAVREETASAVYRELEAAGVRPVRMDARILGRWRTLKDAGEIAAQGRQVVILLGDGSPELIVAQDGVPLMFRVLDIPEEISSEERIEELLRESANTLLSVELDHGVSPIEGVWIGEPGAPSAALGNAFQQEYPSATVSLRDLSHFPPAVAGVGLRMADQPEGGLDLVPGAFRRMGTARAFRRRLLGAAVGVVCFWAVTVAGLLGLMAYENMTLSGLQAQRDKWKTPASEVGAVKRRVGVIRLYMDQRHSALECLREIGERKPDGVFLSAMTYKKGEAIRMNGDADSAEAVYALKANLATSPLFQGSDGGSLIGPNHDPRRNKYTFELRLALPAMPGGQP